MLPTHHRCATVTGALGTCARIAGEYIASTRVGGRLKRPAPFSRIVYATVNDPRGTQAK